MLMHCGTIHVTESFLLQARTRASLLAHPPTSQSLEWRPYRVPSVGVADRSGQAALLIAEISGTFCSMVAADPQLSRWFGGTFTSQKTVEAARSGARIVSYTDGRGGGDLWAIRVSGFPPRRNRGQQLPPLLELTGPTIDPAG